MKTMAIYFLKEKSGNQKSINQRLQKNDFSD